MKYLFEEIKEVEKKVQSAEKVFLFLDYDGTLVPIKSRPELAVFPAPTRKLIKKLSSLPKIYLAIVTGRSFKEIKDLIDVKGIIYIGNHGLEIECGEEYWVHPATTQIRPMIKKILSDMKGFAKEIPGVLIEDKGLIVSIHYRLVTEKSAEEIRKMVSKIVSPYSKMFCIGRGKKVYEIRPLIDWNKGKAISKVSELLGITRKTLRIYIGDDLTDEDAFKVLEKEEISVVVGRRESSSARYFCRNSNEVYQFLSTVYPIIRKQ
ncbi:trehalose-phosphatase [candidate division WOR-3 bacterium]|nr:trehalose-phosphatase [candidate division WOR-3 bacterium]